MSTVAKKPISAEEFWQMPGHENFELINGALIPLMPPGGEHGDIAVELASRLRNWSKETKAGRIGTESGFLMGKEPDKLRGPDIFFIKAERNIPVPKKWYETYPDFVVKVISGSDTSKEVKEKLEDYFGAGTSLIWLIYPDFKQVEAHTPEGIMRIFRENDVLETDLLPGFSCKVSELFDF